MTDRFILRVGAADDAEILRSLQDAVHPEYSMEPPELRLATQLDAPPDAPFRNVTLDATPADAELARSGRARSEHAADRDDPEG